MKRRILMATFLMTCQIIIGQYRFDRCHSFRIKKSWKELVDTCNIKMPLLKGKLGVTRQSLADLLKQGDKVQVRCGYVKKDRSWERIEFEGFVTSIKPSVPVEIECEDNSYLLRRTPINNTWASIKLKDLLVYLIAEANKTAKAYNMELSVHPDVPDVDLGEFRIKANALECLKKLKDEYGLAATFQDTRLFVGLAYSLGLGTQESVKFSLGWNIISSDLTYQKSDGQTIKVNATAILKNNKKIKVSVGFGDNEIPFITARAKDEGSLTVLATEYLNSLSYVGYEGKFLAFLIPWVDPMMTVDLEDPDYEGRAGTYIVDETELNFSRAGGRREATLGIKLSG